MANNLKLEVILQAVDRVTRPIKAITRGNQELAQAFKATRERLKELDKTQGAIDSFRKLSKDCALTSNQFKEAQARVRALAQQFAQTQQPTAAMTRAFQAAKQATADLKQRGETLQNNLISVRERLNAAGISTRHLAEHQRDLKAQLVGTNQTLAQQQTRLKLNSTQQQQMQAARARYDKGMQRRNQMAGTGVSMVGAGMTMGLPVVKMVKDYVSYEDAMTGIARQIPGARNDAGQLTKTYHDMSAAIKNLSEEVPISTTQLIDMTTAAARMNVGAELLEQAQHAERAGNRFKSALKQKEAIDELIGFNRTVAMMAVAFDAIPDEIAENMGKVAKNFKIPITNIRSLADTINYLDDNAISKGSDIIDVLNRTSGVISSVKMDPKDAAALASTLLTLGERTETASTAINAITQKFAAAEKGTKKFRSAVQEIGLNTNTIQMGMANDAMATLFNVIKAVKQLPKNKQLGVMVELVGMEHSDTLAKLVDKPEELQKQAAIANGIAAQGSVEREFNNKLETLSARAQMLQNKIFNRSAEGGEILRPTLASLMDSIGGVVDKFNDWAKANPELASALIKTTALLAGFLTVMGGLTLALAALFGPFVILRFAMTAIGLKGGVLTTVFRGIAGVLGGLPALFTTLMSTGLRVLSGLGQGLLLLSRLLIAHPLIALISGLAMGAIWIWQNWNSLGPKLGALWDSIALGAGNAWDSVKHATNQVWEVIKTKLGALWATIKTQFSDITYYFGVELPAAFTGFGKNILNGLANGITQALGPVKAAITNAAQQIILWFKEKLGIHSPSRVFAQLGEFTMAGFDQGLTDNQSTVLATMQGFAKKLSAAGALALGSTALVNASSAATLMGSHATTAAAIVIDKRPPLMASATGVGSAALNGINNAHSPASIGNVTINIHAQAGQDANAIAREVARQIETLQRQAQARQRSRLIDNY
ncbi:MAG: phage tail tape measure protein [Ottowia sp.]|nr:phage tail tape measure protein [Ottowia sp.]